MKYQDYIWENLPWLKDHTVLFSPINGDIKIIPYSETPPVRKPRDQGLETTFHEMVRSDDFIGVSIILTRRCNLNCAYCYEKPYFQDRSMTPEMGMKIVSWISQEILRKRPRHLDLFLYGGEPLLNPELAKLLLVSFRSLCHTHHIRFSNDTNSNGLLLTPALARELSEAGLQALIITIDGPPEVQHSRRGGSTRDFEKLLEHIRAASQWIPITVRSNLDVTNYHQVGQLLEILSTADLLTKVRFVVHIMGQCMLPRCSIENFGHNVSYHQLDRQLQELAGYLADITFRYGLKPITHLKGFVGESCNNMAWRSFTIDVSGEIYRSSCAAISRYQPHYLGTVEKTGLNPNSEDVFNEKIWRRCLPKKCDFLPICQGGCQSDLYLHQLPNAPLRCPKKYLLPGIRAYLTYILKLYKHNGTFERLLTKDIA